MRLHLLLWAPLPGSSFHRHGVGSDFQLMSEHSGCVPQLDPSREGVGAALLGAGAPPQHHPPPTPAQPGCGCEGLGATGLQEPSTTQKQKAEQNGNPRKVPELGARGPGGGRGRLRGRLVHAFGVDQTRMGGSLLSPRYSAREAFIQPFLHSSS